MKRFALTAFIAPIALTVFTELGALVAPASVLLWSGFSAQHLHAQTAPSLASWQSLGSPPPLVSSIVATRDKRLYCSAPTGIYESRDLRTWHYLLSAPRGRFASAPDGRLFVYGAALHVSSDDGATWKQLSIGSPWDIVSDVGFTTASTASILVLRLGSLQSGSLRRLVVNSMTNETTVVDASPRDTVGIEWSSVKSQRAVILDGDKRTLVSIDSSSGVSVIVSAAAVRASVGLASAVDACFPVGRYVLLPTADGFNYDVSGSLLWSSVRTFSTTTESAASKKATTLTTIDNRVFVATPTALHRSNTAVLDAVPDFTRLAIGLPPLSLLYSSASPEKILPVLKTDNGLVVFSQDTSLHQRRPTFVHRSSDMGTTWRTDTVRGLPNTLGFSRIVASASQSQGKGGGALYVTDDVFKRPALYRSNDGGLSWRELPSVGRYPRYVGAHTTTGTLLVAPSNAGGNAFLRSTDNGETWSVVQGLPTHLAHHGAVSFVHTTNATMVNIRRVGLFRSTDDGATFRSIGEGITGVERNADVFHVAAAPDGTLFALTVRAVYRSVNGGVAWQRFVEGLAGNRGQFDEEFAPLSLAFDSLSAAYLGTTRGLYKLPPAQNTPTNVRDAAVNGNAANNRVLKGMPQGILQQMLSVGVAPNPTRGDVVVRWTLAERAEVRFELYSLAGERMLNLESGVWSAGQHEQTLDTHSLAAGVYVLTVNANGSRSSAIINALR